MAEDNNEKIGFHKGSLATLAKEREELVRMLGIVEKLMSLHIEELKRLGIDLEAEAKKAKDREKEDKKKPIEDLLK